MPVVDRFMHNRPPRNEGSPNIARSAIDQTLVAATKQYENALSVNARPVLYYARKLSGIRCTCAYGRRQSSSTGVMNNPGAVSAAEPDGFGTQEFIDSVTQGTAFSINRYGTKPNDPNYQPPPQPATIGAIQRTATQLDDPATTEVDAEDSEDFFETPASENLFNEAPKSCGVCMNTGFVGGYDPRNMLRQVYDAQSAWEGVVGDETSRPFSFELAGTPSIVIKPPRSARNLIALRIWNNREQLTGCDITVNGTPFAKAWRTNLGLDMLVKFKFKDPETRFTHLEVMWDIAMPPIFVEWGKLEFTENLDVVDQINDVQVMIAPSVPSVALYDIIVEDVFNRSWKVTDVNTAFDREKHVNGWGASLRVLQRYEIYNMLPHMKLRTYHWANQTVPTYRTVPGIAPVEPYSAGGQTPFR